MNILLILMQSYIIYMIFRNFVAIFIEIIKQHI